MKTVSLIATAILAIAASANALNSNRDEMLEADTVSSESIPNPSLDTASGIDSLANEETPTNGLILNFHNVPLNVVLSYLSAKAGLIVVSEVDLRGDVSVVADQPVGTNDIVELLSAQLARNHYAVTLTGHTLTIMDAALAKTSALTPVVLNRAGPREIPMNDQIVTEILPLHTAQAAQLLKELEVLIPAGDSVAANEAANAIIMTASQKDVHHLSEIIATLDSTSISEIEVFALKYGDAKSVAAELTEIFQTGGSDATSVNTRNDMGFGGPGGGPPPGFPGDFGGNATQASTKNAQTHAVFVADDQLNAIVASAPPASMQTVSNLIANLDRPTQGVTEIRVLRLQHADPSEIVDELSNLFPSGNTGSDQNNQSMGFQFESMRSTSSSSASQNTRKMRQTTVMAAADLRTHSVIVTAGKEMMEQVKEVVRSLDQGRQGVQKVTSLDFGGADPGTVQATLAGLFSSANGGGASSTTTTTPLANRYTGNANSLSATATTASTTTSIGGSGAGASTAH